MDPYYQDDYCTIYHADCREVLESIGAVDRVVTDPPYGILGAKGSNKARCKSAYEGFEDTPEIVKEVVIPALFELAQWDSMALTPGVKCMHLYPACDSFGVYHSPWSNSLQRFGVCDAHPILYFGRYRLQGKSLTACSYQMNGQSQDNGHPCPKPFNAWQWLVNKICDKEDTVLDPFMGSGTTLRACKDLGIKSIGVELSERYCEIAVNRLQQEVFDYGGV